MRHKHGKTSLCLGVLLLTCCLLFVSCAGEQDTSIPSSAANPQNAVDRQPSSFKIDLDTIASLSAVSLTNVPTFEGGIAEESENGVIDYSFTSDGYFSAKYLGEKTGDDSDIVILIYTPNPEFPKYQYYLSQNEDFYVFPFTEGDGKYTIGMFKRLTGNDFVQLMAVECDVTLVNELQPFLITNQKVNYSGDSLSVKLAVELTKENNDFFEKVGSVYNYVITNISYDTEKATAALNGELLTYIPDNDQTLRSNKGICFDYATLTAAMLRSIGIPTKVTFGYTSAGEQKEPVYHAWIAVYSAETGWIEKIIEFSAGGWTRMDPTFSAGGNTKSMAEFIGDGNNYIDDFHY